MAKNLYAQTLALQDEIGHVLTKDEKEFKSYKNIVEKNEVPNVSQVKELLEKVVLKVGGLDESFR